MLMTKARWWIVLAAIAVCRMVGAQESDPRLHADGKGWRIEKAARTDAKRPRVLLMGDSILGGYRTAAIRELGERAYVDCWINPYCQGSYRLSEMVAEVLEQGPYDVIFFNMGLHGWQKGRIPDGQFEPLTKKLVEAFRAKAPKASLIWANSTPVTVKGKPEELEPEINPVILDHNAMAAKVMAEEKVPVVDFYSILAPKLALARGDSFHWKGEAYESIAKAAADAIVRELRARGAAKWEKEIAAFEKADAEKLPPKNAILFIGSSSIRLWKTLAADFPNHKVINRGFGGSQLGDSVHFANRVVIPYRPRQIIVYAGGNDLNAGKEPSVAAGDFRAFVETVRAALPNVKIACISIAPNPARWAQVEKVRELNRQLAEYANTAKDVTFIDVFPHMLGADGQPLPGIFVADRLHMNPKGYAIWTKLILPHLTAE